MLDVWLDSEYASIISQIEAFMEIMPFNWKELARQEKVSTYVNISTTIIHVTRKIFEIMAELNLTWWLNSN